MDEAPLKVFRWVMCLAVFGLAVNAQEEIQEAAVSRFAALPGVLRQDLRNRGCTVPQAPGSRKLENVIRGHFRDPLSNDWAVVCDVRSRNTSMILVYWNASAFRPAVIGKWPLSERSCWTMISAVGRSYILEHYRAYGGPKPPPIDHQGIDVGICDKASTIAYFYRNQWLTLTGAD